MNASALLAAKAYGSVASAAGPAGGAIGPQIAQAGETFATMLAGQVSSALEAGRAAEAQATAAVTGKAELVDVVTAVAAAEVQMETMIAFRDQAIQAYQEILRMPI